MISIVTVSKEYSRTGLQDYVVKINGQLITKFQHTAGDGLAECLRKAAKACDEAGDVRCWQRISMLQSFGGICCEEV